MPPGGKGLKVERLALVEMSPAYRPEADKTLPGAPDPGRAASQLSLEGNRHLFAARALHVAGTPRQKGQSPKGQPYHAAGTQLHRDESQQNERLFNQ
jgi:hypothetical protein